MSTPARASSWLYLLGGVILESRRVVAAHSRHFLALSVLFLLPLSSLLISSPSLLLSSPSLNPNPTFPPQSLLRSPHPHPHLLSFLLLFAALSTAALLLSLAAAAATTHSAHRGFFGRPVKLLPALRSLPLSLLRLLLTLLAALLPLAALLTILSSLLFLSLYFLPSSFSPFSYCIFFAAAALALIHLIVTYSLAPVVAVSESTWGFKPLSRSSHLIHGMRFAALSLFLFFTAGIGLILWGFSLGKVGSLGNWREILPVVARTVFGSAATTVLLLYWLVANAVMYMYCKALHGELAEEIAEEFAWEYVCLPFDEEKVPHVVSVVRQ